MTLPQPMPWTPDPMQEPWRLEFNKEGHLHSVGHVGWREPVCPVCGEAIHWCLDMFSFTTGGDHVMAHARCVSSREAFTEQRRKAAPDL